MITCGLRYVIDPFKLDEFEHYTRLWMPLVARYGGTHHGYFLLSEGANNIALAMFSLESFAEYEHYREASAVDREVIEARRFARDTRCFSNHERTFFRPLAHPKP